MIELDGIDIKATARAMREGTLTSLELTRRCLRRGREKDSLVQAWAWLDEAAALRHARKADALRRGGEVLGPLHGIPIAVKDIIYTKGVPTGMGSPIFRDFVPGYSATCVRKLEAAGAFVMGKSVTTEFANQKPGKTRNPWNPAFTPGGSSSGSAAAVASGFVLGALGTQTRGSTIRPAVYCGAVGYKPSFGMISRFGVHALSEPLDHVGIIARSIDDAGLMAACMAGYDVTDAHSLRDDELPQKLDALPRLRKPPVLAAVRSPVWHLADRWQRALFAANQKTLREAGARVQAIELPRMFDDAIAVTRVIHLSEIAHNYGPLMKRHAKKISPRFAEFYNDGLKYSAADYLSALHARKELQEALAEFLEDYDAIITPPATGEPPRTLAFTGDANFCTLWTLCGFPCIGFPTGFGPNRMPIGIQVVGNYLNDRETLRVAKWCMDRLPFPLGSPGGV